AEDGIRDRNVTGVQTCALPIFKTLREQYGVDNVIGTDIRKDETNEGPFEVVDVTDEEALFKVCEKYEVDTLMHLAALLSARAEEDRKSTRLNSSHVSISYADSC